MRTLLIRYIVLWLAGLQLVFWCSDWWKITTLVSCFVYPALLVWLFSTPAVRSQWDRANRIARWSAATLVVLMINAQLMRDNDLTYPLVSWTMYASRRPEAPRYTELAGVRTDGTEFRLDVDNLSLHTMPYAGLLHNYYKEIEKLGPDAGTEVSRRRALLEKVLIRMGQHTKPELGDSPLARVELVEKTVADNGEIAQRTVLIAAVMPASKGAR